MIETRRTITKDEFVMSMMEMASSVYDFHDRFSLEEVNFNDEFETTMHMQYKIGRQLEEMGELNRALNRGDYDNMQEEIADNIYVAMGISLVTGNNSQVYIDDVVHKNGKKTPDNYIVRNYQVIKRNE